MNLHLLIPSLFWPGDSLPEIYRDLPLPALETLLAKSLRTENDSQGVEAWLCRAFDVTKQQDWPVAPLTLQADSAGQMTAENHYWLRADPVHLRLEHNQIVLADSQIFRITAEEANQLADLLNRHFAADGCDPPSCNPEPARQKPVFLPLTPDRWYLRVAETPTLQTHALSVAAGRNIHVLLPSGADSMRWQGLFNEVQMLLHEHPLNQAREARGELAINGIWLWGGGIMPQSLNCPYTQVWSNATLPRSLALACATDHAALPSTATAWRQSAVAGNHLVVLDVLQEKTQYDDAYGWRESLKKLEQDWFAPLLIALKQGRLDQLTLTAIDERGSKNFTITRDDLWKFWRAAKPLVTYSA
ncbi:MAG: phosphoglycerate mutase [Pseudomonadota bacterium]